jgi:hypothetical protein
VDVAPEVLEAVALHEAAHAVVAIVLGLPLTCVTVDPSDPHTMIEISGEPSPRTRRRLIAYFYAGPAATQEFTPGAPLGDETDVKGALALGGERMIFRGRVRALWLVQKLEKEIRRVADELLAKGELSGEEVRSLVCGPVKRMTLPLLGRSPLPI